MADTAHKTAEEIRERFDTEADLNAKVDQVARLLLASAFPVVWTGAGVSTSCGVPDFRGPQGKWTLQAQKKQRDPTIKVVDTTKASPSLSHMSLVQLMNKGILKRLISTNTDGLHRRSGIDPSKLAELHGCGQKLRCDKCAKYVFLDTRVRCAAKVHDHKTPQKCIDPSCSGTLCDTIINFGEYLHDECQGAANTFGEQADMLMVLGSSLRVITCDALEEIQKKKKSRGGKRGNLVIVNLQTTPYDDACAIRVWAKTDDFMAKLMAKLQLEIPDYKLVRRMEVAHSSANCRLGVRGLEPFGGSQPYGWATKMELQQHGMALGQDAQSRLSTASRACRDLNMEYTLKGGAPAKTAALVIEPTSLRGEPSVILPLSRDDLESDWRRTYFCVYDPKTNAWTISRDAADAEKEAQLKKALCAASATVAASAAAQKPDPTEAA